MDNYDRYEQDLNEKHDYDVCMATCPDWKSPKECGCGGSDEALVGLVFGLSILFFVAVGTILYLIGKYQDKKKYKEFLERTRKDKSNGDK